MSETPETDKESFEYDEQCKPAVDAEFAAKLERERDALKLKNAKLYNLAELAIEEVGWSDTSIEAELRAKLELLKED